MVPTRRIDIAVAALVRDGQVLLVHRHPSRDDYPDCWDLPGGHVEPGETPEDAVRRECAEELGVTVGEVERFALRCSNPGLVKHAYLVTSWHGEPANRAPGEHDDMRWVGIGALTGLTMSDPAALPDLVAAVREQPQRTGVVVTGAPGSGKSTLGRALAASLPGVFLSLDALKEELHRPGELDGWPLRQAAEARLVALLAEVTAQRQVPVVDIWVQPGRDDVRVTDLLAQQLDRIVEVTCQVPADVAVSRFFARERGGPHDNARPGLEEQIRAAVAAQRPLAVDASLAVDTSVPVDADEVVQRVRGLLRREPEG